MRVLRLATVAVILALAACGQPREKPPPPEPTRGTSQPAAGESSNKSDVTATRVGTVGLVRELKDRGMTADNWAGVIGSVFTNDTEKDVIRVRYEVTIFFKDGTQGVVVVNQRPGVQAGQRVRVTGSDIEPLER
jgi:hypothetical protein